MARIYIFIKGILDFIISSVMLIILLPLFLAVSVIIKLTSKGPVFFRQKRVGKNKKLFTIHKFRTMRIDAPKDCPTHLLENPEKYITGIGKILRKTSLDELPQLLDIFTGRMSVIGPRPALYNQDDLVAERDKYNANGIRPGLTGLAQINGRDAIEIPDKAKLDGEYVKNISLWLDIKIFFKTIFSVLKSDGVVEGKHTGGEIANATDFGDTKVSVVVATYKRDEALKAALASLVSQTYKNIEIIVVDDSADNTWNEKTKAATESLNDPRVIFFQNEKNIGSANTRNKGIELSTGDYITFLDDDDEYLPEKVEKQLSHMLNSGSDFSVTDLALYDDSNGKLIEKRTRKNIEKYKREDLIKYHLIYHITGTDTMMFKRDYLVKIGGFSPIDAGDEFYLMVSAIENGGAFSHLSACDVKAYVHNTTGLSAGETKIEGANALFEYKKKYFKSLSRKEVRQIKMRHYAVIAYANLKMKKRFTGLSYLIKSFFRAPINFIRLYFSRG